MSTFLQPLLRDRQRAWTLVDADTGTRLAGRVTAAVDSASRRQGLLGRTSLDDEALVIAPCNAVHTFFMAFPIDVLFVDKQGQVLKVVPDVRPWRIAGALRGFATIELAAGTASRTSTTAGHRIALVEVTDT
jgi:uncharacterized membrane protein (UPF0127 family)